VGAHIQTSEEALSSATDPETVTEKGLSLYIKKTCRYVPNAQSEKSIIIFFFRLRGGSRPGLLHPHPDPVHKDGKVLLHGAVVGEPQPPLSRLARHLDGVAQVIGPLGAPVHYVESVLADLVSQDEQDEDRDLGRISGESTVRPLPQG
jgi:hypothetical protein